MITSETFTAVIDICRIGIVGSRVVDSAAHTVISLGLSVSFSANNIPQVYHRLKGANSKDKRVTGEGVIDYFMS